MKIRALISAALACLMLCACEKTELPPADSTPQLIQYSETEPLVCPAETLEEAEAIAEQYGIELVDFSYGVASFYTEEDPRELIQRGIDNGWPELSLNRVSKLD